MKVVVTGSLAFDFIMDFPGKFSDHILPEKIHAINLSFLVKDMKRQLGGTAGNIAYNLALLGAKPIILAAAGHDFSDYKNFLNEVNVDTSMIRIIEAEPTASAFIFTDLTDNQIIGFYPGAMKFSQGLSLTRFHQNLGGTLTQKPFVVISPNEPSAMVRYVKECQELEIDYLFDPGMQLPRLSGEDLRLGIKGAKIVVGNDYEVAIINSKIKKTRSRQRRTIATPVIRDQNAKLQFKIKNEQILITTLGEKGSKIDARGTTYTIPPAKPKTVLDPTGAGDAYRAGFLAGYFRGFPLKTCGKMGSVCAIYTVEKYGTTTHKFTKEEFCQRYKENYKEELILQSFP